MKSLSFTCLFSITFLLAAAQQNNAVIIGSVDSIRSQVLKEQRKFWVHVPASARDGQHAKKKYPVVYLLDGDWNFTGVVGIIQLLTSVNGNSFFPEMIVVGILNTDRMRDMTPTRVTSGLWVDENIAKVSGGGEAFTEFLEKELIPHINANFPTNSYRMLIGHSLGGLIAVNTMLHHTKLFNSYIAIDPSMWWDQQKLLHETEKAFKTNAVTHTSIFLGMAHTQGPDMDTVALQKDTTTGTLHPRSILQLGKNLMAGNKNGLQANYKYYDQETHSSVPLMATYDGLHFIFKDYALNFRDNYFTDSSFRLAAFLEEHFHTVTTEYGMTSEDGSDLLPPEDMVNNLGFFVLGKGHYDKAEAMFQLNVKNYPAGNTAYNYLGDLYAAKGEKAKAIASYKKSLSLKASAEISKKIKDLNKK